MEEHTGVLEQVPDETTMRELIARYPNMELDPQLEPPNWEASTPLRGLPQRPATVGGPEQTR